MTGTGKRRGEHGSAGLLALILASALGAAGLFSLTPTLSHVEVLAGKEQLIGGGQVLSTSSPTPTTIGQVVADLHESDPGLPLSSGPVATRSGLVGIAVSPGGAWVLAERVAGACVVVSGASAGITESETPVSATERCVA